MSQASDPKSRKNSSNQPSQIDEKTDASGRIIKATRQSSSSKFLGSIDILAYTKHGATAMISVAEAQKLETGDILKTTAWILNGKQFTVIGRHQKPMKLPGDWYEVQVVTP